MKKSLLGLLVVCSFSATAAPYVGLEYGFGSSNTDFDSTFKAEGIKLEPKSDDGIMTVFLGYSVSPSWAVELGYSQFDLDDSQSKKLGIANVGGKDYHHEMEWDSSVKAKQISLAPVFTYALNDRWSTKLKAGLTYTQYKSSESKSEEYELVTNDDIEMDNNLFHRSSDSNEIGAMFALGTEYAVLPQLTVGANVKYQLDNYANTASFNLGTTYYF